MKFCTTLHKSQPVGQDLIHMEISWLTGCWEVPQSRLTEQFDHVQTLSGQSYRGDKPTNWPVRIYIYMLLVKKATLAIPATLAKQKALMFQPAAPGVRAAS